MIKLPETTKKSKSKAQNLIAAERARIGVSALLLGEITSIANKHQVSRKFVYRQEGLVNEALHRQFEQEPGDDKELFSIKVTKEWIEQVCLSLMLICKASYRNVIDTVDCLFDHKVSLGGLHNLMSKTHEKAQEQNNNEDLSSIRIGAHDEIYQGSNPVIAGVDVTSGYCYELGDYGSCNGETWALVLMELKDRGLHLNHVIADSGPGLRSGHREASPNMEVWADHFHVIASMKKLMKFFERRAYRGIEKYDLAYKRVDKATRKIGYIKAHNMEAYLNRPELLEFLYSRHDVDQIYKLVKIKMFNNTDHLYEFMNKAIHEYDSIRILVNWLQNDVLSPSELSHSDRLDLYEFILEELSKVSPVEQKQIKTAHKYLSKSKELALLFSHELDFQINRLALNHNVDETIIRNIFKCESSKYAVQAYHEKLSEIRFSLGEKFYEIHTSVRLILKNTKRGSGVVEGFNSRLRSYFNLRKRLGDKYLNILRFFLNNHRQQRSRREGGSGKSPAERLYKQRRRHWLEQLDYTLFRQAV